MSTANGVGPSPYGPEGPLSALGAADPGSPGFVQPYKRGKRSEKIQLWTTLPEKRKWESRAQVAGLSLSEWIRSTLDRAMLRDDLIAEMEKGS